MPWNDKIAKIITLIEVYVKISKLIGHIGNACLVTEIFHRVAGTAD